MSHATQLKLRLERDGDPVDGFPIVTTLDVNQVQGFLIGGDEDGAYQSLPIEQIAQPLFLALLPSAAVRLRLGNQQTSNLPVVANGFLLLYKGTLIATSDKTAIVKAETASRLEGVAGG